MIPNDTADALHRAVMGNARLAQLDGEIDALDLRITALIQERAEKRREKAELVESTIAQASAR